MWRRMWIVFSKEVLDNARDKRSLLVAFIYPLLGPILLGTMIAVVSRVAVDAPTQGMVLPVAGAEHAPELVSWLKERRVTVVPSPGEPHAAVRRGIAEAIVVVPEEFRGAFDNEKPAPISVVVNSSRLSGLVQMNRVATILSDFNQAIWGERISARGIDHRSLQPLMIESVNVTTGAHIADIFLFMVPPLFIFNLFMGGRLPLHRHHVGRARARFARAPVDQPGGTVGADERQVLRRALLCDHRRSRPAAGPGLRLQGRGRARFHLHLVIRI